MQCPLVSCGWGGQEPGAHAEAGDSSLPRQDCRPLPTPEGESPGHLEFFDPGLGRIIPLSKSIGTLGKKKISCISIAPSRWLVGMLTCVHTCWSPR